MYLKSIRVENYRLLKDVTISFDSSLTLFVGKNNTGKTSIMHVIEFLLSNSTQLAFDDYPLECRQTLYSAIERYWQSESENPITDFKQSVPITKVTMTVDYSDDNMGNVSSFVIDLGRSDLLLLYLYFKNVDAEGQDQWKLYHKIVLSEYDGLWISDTKLDVLLKKYNG